MRLIGLISAYGAISMVRIGLQATLAHKARNEKYTRRGRLPLASIIVATYNEDPALLDRSMASLAAQDYSSYEVIVVDDGSDNAETNREIVRKYGFRYIYQPNAGKRHAMYRAFQHLSPRSKVILTADGDTVWEPQSARELVRAVMMPGVGAATGFVGVLNTEDNWLTKMCDTRYWMAFNIERAAQSVFGTVSCVSGPLGAYRRSLIEEIKDEFVSQRFLGKPCTFGDDRHLTNLVLRRGWKVKYASGARCLSDCPTSLSKYLKQQTRWGKSHWREMLWQVGAFRKQSPYMVYDWMLTLILPFLLLASISHYAYLTVTGHPFRFLELIATILLMSVVRIIPAFVATRSSRFVWFILFSFVSIIFLMPLKFWALFTMTSTGWGTRSKLAIEPELSI